MARQAHRKLTLTDKLAASIPPPVKGYELTYDDKEQDLALCVTANGHRAYWLRYRDNDKPRYWPFGRVPEWRIAAARIEANNLKARIRAGFNPHDAATTQREAKSFFELCDEYIDNFLPDKKPSTQRDYRNAIEHDLRPRFAKQKLADINLEDVRKFHREKSKTAPNRANLLVVLLQGMFTKAVEWKWVSTNPVKIQRKNSPGIQLNPENERERTLEEYELPNLLKAMTEHKEDRQGVQIIQMLLMTGARVGETQAAKWVDIKNCVWTKPARSTKSGKVHRVPLSGPARALLAELRTNADAQLKALDREIAGADDDDRPKLEEWRQRVETFVFPARKSEVGHRVEIRKTWVALCKAAGMVTKGKPTMRIHDCRHTFATMAINEGGASLFVVGKMLGHSDMKMTERYSKVLDATMLATAERVGARFTGKPSAEIVPMKKRRK